MQHSALYFPYIEVPDDPSLTRVLLYWDRVGSIVPERVRNRDLSPRMLDLIDAGLVEPVAPEEVETDAFDDGFIELLDAAPFLRSAHGTTRVHRDKATHALWQQLSERNLVQIEHEHSGDWYLMPEQVAALYMAYLAVRLSAQHRSVPVTDRRTCLAPFIELNPEIAYVVDVDRVRGALLRDILPAPSEPVDVRALSAFKERHWDLLRSFRLEIEKRIFAVDGEADRERRRRALELAAEELEDELLAIESRMRTHWTVERSAFAAAITAGAAAVKWAITGEPTDAIDVPLPLLPPLLERLGDTGPWSRGEFQRPLAYASLARREFREGDARWRLN